MENKELDRAISAACDELVKCISIDDCTEQACPFGFSTECLSCSDENLKDRLEVWFRKKYGFEVEK